MIDGPYCLLIEVQLETFSNRCDEFQIVPGTPSHRKYFRGISIAQVNRELNFTANVRMQHKARVPHLDIGTSHDIFPWYLTYSYYSRFYHKIWSKSACISHSDLSQLVKVKHQNPHHGKSDQKTIGPRNSQNFGKITYMNVRVRPFILTYMGTTLYWKSSVSW